MRLHEWALGACVALLLSFSGLGRGAQGDALTDLAGVLEELEAEVPLGYPVVLGLGTEDPENWGESWWDDEAGVFRIQIARGHRVIQRDTLLHEYAHCRVWETETDHGPFWGVAYAEAYRAVEE